MARTKATFKQADVRRAMRAIEATGGRVTHVEVHSDKVILFTAIGEIKALAQGVEPNEWDGIDA